MASPALEAYAEIEVEREKVVAEIKAAVAAMRDISSQFHDCNEDEEFMGRIYYAFPVTDEELARHKEKCRNIPATALLAKLKSPERFAQLLYGLRIVQNRLEQAYENLSDIERGYIEHPEIMEY